MNYFKRSSKVSKIFFRCEGNIESGFGHFTRCIQISSFLKNQIIFIGHFNELAISILKDKNISFAQIAKPNHFNNDIPKYLEKGLLIIDSYVPKQEYYDNLNKLDISWGAFDDFNDLRFKGAKFVLNFRVGAQNMMKYESDCALLGVKYMPIDTNFLRLRNLRSNLLLTTEPKKALIFIGSSDLNQISIHIIDILKELYPSLDITTVLSEQDYKNFEHDKIKQYKHLRLVKMKHNITDLLEDIDFIITGGGKFKYETCYSCIPSITISQTEGQYDDSLIFEEKKLTLNSGTTYSYDKIKLQKCILKIQKLENRARMIRHCKKTFTSNSNQNLAFAISNLL